VSSTISQNSTQRWLWAILLITLLGLPQPTTGAQASTDGFDPQTGWIEPVRAVALQADGKVLIGGAFQIGPRSGIARLLPNGALDEPFQPTTDGTVTAITPLASGKILIGGSFQHVNGQLRPGLARLNPDGTLDAAFDAGVSGGIYVIRVQPDGAILIGGWFTQIGGQARSNIARLLPDGALDQSFTPGWGADSWVNAIALQTDGKVLIAGHFTGVDGYPHAHIARLNANGSRDGGFTPAANADVRTVVVQTNGQVVIGGDFTQVGGQPRNQIARLNLDGTLDSNYTPGRSSWDTGSVDAMTLLSDDRLLISGHFKQGAYLFYRFLRLTVAGTTDGSFVSTLNDVASAIVVQPDGKVVIGGSFTAVDGHPRTRVARVRSDGSLDSVGQIDQTFHPVVNDLVLALRPLPNGQTLIGGGFSTVNGSPARYIARLNADGSTDPAFQSLPSWLAADYSLLYSIVVQGDGKILIGGVLNNPNGGWKTYVHRLNPDGSLDSSFAATIADGYDVDVRSIALQADGKVLVGGQFAQVGGQPRTNLARLNPNGTLDPSLKATIVGRVRQVAALPNGKILIGGNFSSVNGQALGTLVRLNSDGSTDTTFTPAVDWQVSQILVQPDGTVLVGGEFNQVAGQQQKYIARFNADGSFDRTFHPTLDRPVSAITTQTDGKLVLSGSFTSVEGEPHSGIARLNQDGSVDPTLASSAQGVFALAVQADGKIVVGGNFFFVEGQRYLDIARLNPSAPRP
jgi:uncharacterized delta-60 repeat protein